MISIGYPTEIIKNDPATVLQRVFLRKINILMKKVKFLEKDLLPTRNSRYRSNTYIELIQYFIYRNLFSC